MQYLYGIKPGKGQTLVATFDSEEQLLAYVRWATLGRNPDGSFKFEQGSALSGGYNRWEQSVSPMTADEPFEVTHNPTPSML
jgi:hypothetical protein